MIRGKEHLENSPRRMNKRKTGSHWKKVLFFKNKESENKISNQKHISYYGPTGGFPGLLVKPILSNENGSSPLIRGAV